MEQCLHQWFFLNGELRGSCDFHEGLFNTESAIYEVIRVIDGKPLFFEEHLERFNESAKLADLRPFPDKQFIFNAVRLLIETNNISIGNFKLFLGRQNGSAEPIIAAWLIPFFYPSDSMYKSGVSVMLFRHERNQPNAKIVRKSFRTKVEEEMKRTGAYELLLHHDGKITEGSRSNVFFIVDGVLFTAPDETVLKGITRIKVLETIHETGLPLNMSALDVDLLDTVQAAFLCGTSPKVLPICSIDNRYQLHAAHPYIGQISRRFEQKIIENLARFAW